MTLQVGSMYEFMAGVESLQWLRICRWRWEIDSQRWGKWISRLQVSCTGNTPSIV